MTVRGKIFLSKMLVICNYSFFHCFFFLENEQMGKLTEKIDMNFEKILSTQNLFIDSCYRLQMDESQIETKISLILEKLMETFEKK